MTRVLKVDLDIDKEMLNNKKFVELLKRTRIAILRELGLTPEEFIIKPSKNHIHLIIVIKEDVELEKAFLYQLLLGDDPDRFNYNMMRLKYWGEEVARLFNILFTEKKKK